MNKYQEAEKELAELLGWTNILIVTGIPPDGSLVHKQLPQWCSDDAEAFKLMVEYNCYPDCNDAGVVVVGRTEDDCDVFTLIEGHTDKPTAIRYCIVQAVIAKLKGNK